jgi:hypothetical protein
MRLLSEESFPKIASSIFRSICEQAEDSTIKLQLLYSTHFCFPLMIELCLLGLRVADRLLQGIAFVTKNLQPLGAANPEAISKSYNRLGYFAFTSFLGLDQIESTYSFG